MADIAAHQDDINISRIGDLWSPLARMRARDFVDQYETLLTNIDTVRAKGHLVPEVLDGYGDFANISTKLRRAARGLFQRAQRIKSIDDNERALENFCAEFRRLSVLSHDHKQTGLRYYENYHLIYQRFEYYVLAKENLVRKRTIYSDGMWLEKLKDFARCQLDKHPEIRNVILTRDAVIAGMKGLEIANSHLGIFEQLARQMLHQNYARRTERLLKVEI